ncbi:2TM domain-containing protein [Tenacibaculum sp. 190524A05c]|uniref:2TM domain-containing protein n=1 Tax=Tenacibaculum platacis TaxID=3137852 RepID=UPI0032B0FF6B
MSFKVKESKLARVQEKVGRIRSFYNHLILYTVVNLIFAFSANFSEINIHIYNGFKISNQWANFDSYKIYPLWLIWGVVLVINAVTTFGIPIVFGSRWEEKKIEEYMKEDKTKINNI